MNLPVFCHHVYWRHPRLSVNQYPWLIPLTDMVDAQSTVIVSWVSTKMLIECQRRCQSIKYGLNVDQGSIKDIDQHSTMDALKYTWSIIQKNSKNEGTYSHISFVKRSRGCSSWCGGLHVSLSSNISCMGWVSEIKYGLIKAAGGTFKSWCLI